MGDEASWTRRPARRCGRRSAPRGCGTLLATDVQDRAEPILDESRFFAAEREGV